MNSMLSDAAAAPTLMHRYCERLTQALEQHDRRAARQARQDIVLLAWFQLHCRQAHQATGCQLPLRNSCTCTSLAAKPSRSADKAACGLQRPHMNTSTAA